MDSSLIKLFALHLYEGSITEDAVPQSIKERVLEVFDDLQNQVITVEQLEN